MGGFISGGLNTLANGGNVGEAMKTGTISGGISAATAAILGGISAGANAMENGGNCFTGEGTAFLDTYDVSATEENKIKIGEGMTYSNKYAKEFSDRNFGENIKGLANLYADGSMPANGTMDGDFFKYKGRPSRGVAIQNKLGKGTNVYLFKQAFIDTKQLYLTMGHEYIHAGFFSLGLSDKTLQHAAIYDWEYKQANAWKYNIGYFRHRSESMGYIQSKYKNANVFFNIKNKLPW